MLRSRFLIGAMLLLSTHGCGDDGGPLAPGSTVINGATATIEVSGSGASAFPVSTGAAAPIGGLSTPVTAVRTGGSNPVTIASESGRQDVFATGEGDPVRPIQLVEGSMTQLWQRVSGQTLELSVSVDGAAPVEFGGQGFTPASQPLQVSIATNTYVVNVQNRDVAFDDAGTIRFFVVVATPDDDSDAYAVYGVTPGSAGVEATVVRGTPR